MKPGRRLGRYRIGKLLGQGSAGRVFLARDTVLDREVAIKLLRDDPGLPDETRLLLLARMRSEARAAASVRHPNAVVLHDIGEDEELGLFLVFEHVQGTTLRARIEELGPLPPGEIAVLARQLGQALTALHESGFIHRDVKPENVFLSRYGAKLGDFGIAHGLAPDARQISSPGTLTYSAPEALRNGEFSPESDQFSLAATLYEALTGKRAFASEEAIVPLMTPPPITCPDVPEGAREALTRALISCGMAPEPARRHPSCAALGDAVAEALEIPSAPTLAAHPRAHVAIAATIQGGRASRRRNRLVAGALIGLVVLLLMSRPKPESGASTSSRLPELASSDAGQDTALRTRPVP